MTVHAGCGHQICQVLSSTGEAAMQAPLQLSDAPASTADASSNAQQPKMEAKPMPHAGPSSHPAPPMEIEGTPEGECRSALLNIGT